MKKQRSNQWRPGAITENVFCDNLLALFNGSRIASVANKAALAREDFIKPQTRRPQPLLDFSALEGRGKARYIAGVHGAVGHDYTPLAEMFLRVIARTWKRAASSSR